MNSPTSNDDFREEPAISLRSMLLILGAIMAGTLLATVALPAWAPDLTNSLLGTAPKAFWYLSRGSAIVAYLLLWLSMAFGIILTNKMARVWPGGPTAFDLHEYFSLLGVAFALFHALILMGDHYINYTLAQVLLPFASVNYRPVWVGLGQLGFYTFVIVNFSFYIRKQIGQRTWRVLHYVSFLTFLLALIHGLVSGTDTGTEWANLMYWSTGGSLLFLFIYRLLSNLIKSKTARLQARRPLMAKPDRNS